MTSSSNTVTPDASPVAKDRRIDAFELAPVAMAILDRAGLIVVANEALDRLLGGEGVIGEPFLQWLEVASERERFGRAFSGLRHKEPGRGFVSDVRIVPHLERPKPCRLRCTKLQCGEVMVACETTADQQGANVLGAAVLRSLDALDEGMLLVDGQGRVVHANPASEHLWGGRLVGRSFPELVPPAEVGVLAEGSTAARSGNWQGETDILRVDGERVPVELSMAGSDSSLVVLVRDLRERKRRAFEARLAAQIDRLLVTHVEPRQGVMAACSALAGGVGAKVAMVLTETSEGWQWWSGDAAASERPLAKSPPTWWRDDEAPRSMSFSSLGEDEALLLRTVFGPGAGRSTILRVALRSAAGIIGHLLLELDAPLGTLDVELVEQLAAQISLGLAGALKTLERRALEQQILRSQKLAAVGLLAAGIAHEINNPLSGVVGYSQLLLERNLEPLVRERVEKIAQSAERCRKIVEGVLLFARQREGGVRRAVDLAAIAQRVISIGEFQWRMHNVRVQLVSPEDGGDTFVWADADQLEQVVLNLLSNAVDAMPRGGTVRVYLRREGGRVLLVVEDEGHGIPPEIVPRIFDPFFSTKEIGKGTGLGLAISYGIVQDHGGDILVVSAPGEGARFTVTLPAHGSSRTEDEGSSRTTP